MSVAMTFTDEQQRFLEQLALRIPSLFESIRNGNVKSEYIIGLRNVDQRHVRLKLVAEVVDPGANPLRTHGMQVPTELAQPIIELPAKVNNKSVKRPKDSPTRGTSTSGAPAKDTPTRDSPISESSAPPRSIPD